MIANQLVPKGGSTITNLFKSPPTGSQVFKFHPATGGYVFLQFVDGAWEGDDRAMSLHPGEGVFFSTPHPYTHTFVGEILANSAVPLIQGYSVISSALPISGSLPELNFPAENADQVYQYNCATGRYIFNSYFDGFWEGDMGGAAPVAQIGESFFFSNPGRFRTWTRFFTVGP
ncbi:MAG: hypothetical protein L0Y58_25225 [Verrucomicrobia subdivision 3 bacterium]|nr:hypothetical protein [Limisphaerales bacterium]